MGQRVNLDAMIPREDFGAIGQEWAIDLIKDFPLTHLDQQSPIRMQLRKPDFQRETNHWSPEQLATFVASFVDQEVIPSLILWKSPSFIFVIDGGHRLSALRAWMEDDYGDGAISQAYYKGEITDSQKRIARRTRAILEEKVGRFSALRALVGQSNAADPIQMKRAGAMFTRPLQLQWVIGSPQVAETSFYKINSQGTPLDEVEQLLIMNRMKPLAIGARAIMRSGFGHKYWSKFSAQVQKEVEAESRRLFHLLFKPEVDVPLRTLDVPLGGAASPVDALSLIIEFLTYAGWSSSGKIKTVAEYAPDEKGEATVEVLRLASAVANRMTGNAPQSLGLHPAVYFYNESGKHSRFLFLGITLLIAEKLRDNDSGWFKKFTSSRASVEAFLMEEKSLIGMFIRSITPKQRVSKMRDLMLFLVDNGVKGRRVTPEMTIAHLGVKGRIFDGTVRGTGSTTFSDDAKSMVFIRKAMATAQRCGICSGLLDTTKSMSYDHAVPRCADGDASVTNLDLVHPYCNTGFKGGQTSSSLDRDYSR